MKDPPTPAAIADASLIISLLCGTVREQHAILTELREKEKLARPSTTTRGGDETTLAALLEMLGHHAEPGEAALTTLRRVLETRAALAIENDRLEKQYRLASPAQAIRSHRQPTSGIHGHQAEPPTNLKRRARKK